MKKLIKADHLKPMSKNWSFYLTFLIPIFIGVALSLKITWALDFCSSYICYNTFLEINKLPIAILGLAIPFVAIYVYNFRSKQSAELIFIAYKSEIIYKNNEMYDSLSALLFQLKRGKNHFKSLTSPKYNDIKIDKYAHFNDLYSRLNKIYEEGCYFKALSKLYGELYILDANLFTLKLLNDESSEAEVDDEFYGLTICEFDRVINLTFNAIETNKNHYLDKMNILRKEYGLKDVESLG